MIVDHADRLHEGIADGRADEVESALAQVLAHRGGLGRLGRNFLHRLPGVALRRAINESPEVFVEGAELLFDRKNGARILDCGCDFQSIAHDAGVFQQALDAPLVVARDQRRIEVVECLAIAFALAQDGIPAKAGLRAFQHNEFEEPMIIVQRYAPFLVMVAAREVVARPCASDSRGGWFG